MIEKHKIISALLVVVIALLMLSGCTPTSSTTVATTTKEGTQATSENSKQIAFPYTGEEVKFTYLWADLGQGGEITDEMIIAKAYQEKLGNISLVLELLPWTDYDTKQALYLTSGEVPDIMIARNVISVVREYGQNGIFLDYAKYMDDYMPNLAKYATQYKAFDLLKSMDGALYGFPSTLQTEDWAMEGWFYNKAVLDKFDIEIPTTKDEFLNAMRKVKAGDPNIVPFNLMWGMGYLRQAMSLLFDSTDAGVQYNTTTKKWEFGPSKSGSQLKSYLEFLNTLWEEELIHPEINTATDEQFWAEIEEGNWAFSYSYFGSMTTEHKVADTGYMLCPKGDTGNAYSIVTSSYDGSPNWGVVSGVKTAHPEILTQVLDYMYSDEIAELRAWGIEGETFTKDSTGNYTYMNNIKIPSNPTGTVALADLGFSKSPWDRTFGISNIAAQKLQGYDEIALAAEKQNKDALDAGTVLPLYTISTPTLTAEESETVSAILTPIETYLDESYLKFIMGDMKFEEWDSFITNIESYGNIQTVLDIYNSKEMVQYSGNWR